MTKREKNKDISTWGENSVVHGEKIVYKDNKGERNKEISNRGEFDKGKRSIKSLSTQVGGAST